MTIKFHKRFVKHFDKRIKQNSPLLNQFNRRYKLFIEDRKSPILDNHKLSGNMEGKRAFSITGDIRVVYNIVNDTIEFLDIGSHNQVYS